MVFFSVFHLLFMDECYFSLYLKNLNIEVVFRSLYYFTSVCSGIIFPTVDFVDYLCQHISFTHEFQNFS